MDNIAAIAGPPGEHRRWPANATASAPMAASLPRPAIDAMDRCGILLIRNELIQEPLGGRTWRGVLTNATDTLFADVVACIRFHDRDGRAVGAPVSARARRLGSAAVLDLQARLPAEAVGLRVQALSWTVTGGSVELGPDTRLAFGEVQD
jgi:hypothetical protein